MRGSFSPHSSSIFCILVLPFSFMTHFHVVTHRNPSVLKGRAISAACRLLRAVHYSTELISCTGLTGPVSSERRGYMRDVTSLSACVWKLEGNKARMKWVSFRMTLTVAWCWDHTVWFMQHAELHREYFIMWDFKPPHCTTNSNSRSETKWTIVTSAVGVSKEGQTSCLPALP